MVLKGKVEEISTLQAKIDRLTEDNQLMSKQISTLEREGKNEKQLRKQIEEMQIQLSNEQTSNSKLSRTNNDLLVRINDLSLEHDKFASYEERISSSAV